MAHGHDADVHKSVQIAATAIAASSHLDAERISLYVDLVLISLPEAARRALRAMDPVKYEYQSDFAKQYIAVGLAEGIAKGRVEIVLKLLALRFGLLPDALQAKIRTLDGNQLDMLAERILRAPTLDEAVGEF